MLAVLRIVTITLAAIAMSMALAHTLEWSGKKRLSRKEHFVVQAIYYPGFTYAGAAEPLAILAFIALLALTPSGTVSFWLTAAAPAAAALTHVINWTLTAPEEFATATIEPRSSATRKRRSPRPPPANGPSYQTRISSADAPCTKRRRRSLEPSYSAISADPA